MQDRFQKLCFIFDEYLSTVSMGKTTWHNLKMLRKFTHSLQISFPTCYKGLHFVKSLETFDFLSYKAKVLRHSINYHI